MVWLSWLDDMHGWPTVPFGLHGPCQSSPAKPTQGGRLEKHSDLGITRLQQHPHHPPSLPPKRMPAAFCCAFGLAEVKITSIPPLPLGLTIKALLRPSAPSICSLHLIEPSRDEPARTSESRCCVLGQWMIGSLIVGSLGRGIIGGRVFQQTASTCDGDCDRAASARKASGAR